MIMVMALVIMIVIIIIIIIVIIIMRIMIFNQGSLVSTKVLLSYSPGIKNAYNIQILD